MGEGNGTPLQYSCLENPMDGGAWWAAVYGVAWSRTRLKQLSSSSSSSMVCISAEALQLRQTVQKCGQVELPLTQGQGRRPRGATPCPQSGAAAERSNPTSNERLRRGCRRAERSYSTFKVMGAAEVRETKVRW